jgi:serine/threonine protein kinase
MSDIEQGGITTPSGRCYTLYKVLGKGAFGVVYKAELQGENTEFAVKWFDNANEHNRAHAKE